MVSPLFPDVSTFFLAAVDNSKLRWPIPLLSAQNLKKGFKMSLQVVFTDYVCMEC